MTDIFLLGLSFLGVRLAGASIMFSHLNTSVLEKVCALLASQRKQPYFQDADKLLAHVCSPFLVFFHGRGAVTFQFVDKEVSSRKVLCTSDHCFRDYLW